MKASEFKTFKTLRTKNNVWNIGKFRRKNNKIAT